MLNLKEILNERYYPMSGFSYAAATETNRRATPGLKIETRLLRDVTQSVDSRLAISGSLTRHSHFLRLFRRHLVRLPLLSHGSEDKSIHLFKEFADTESIKNVPPP